MPSRSITSAAENTSSSSSPISLPSRCSVARKALPARTRSRSVTSSKPIGRASAGSWRKAFADNTPIVLRERPLNRSGVPERNRLDVHGADAARELFVLLVVREEADLHEPVGRAHRSDQPRLLLAPAQHHGR